MRSARLKPLPIVMLALLAAGCADNRFRADVTRFHLGQPIARSTVALQPADARAASSLEYRTYAAAVAGKMREIGFTPVDNVAQAELIGVLSYAQTTRAGLPQRSPVSIGIGGGSWGSNVGVSIGTSLGLGGGKSGDVNVNTLSLQLKRRSDNSVIWEGRAVSEAREDKANATLGAAVPQLADVLFRDFPGKSGTTQRYP